ncbi:hypothetical protein [Acinetobacter venetianus]|uniref:hypothetical protein n=1 Tax=Acinetobacter venetianus TaxID=52133 RepID=UPI003A924367
MKCLIEIDTNAFAENYLGKWEVNQTDLRLNTLARKYHEMCEAYDRSVCTGKSEFDQCAMPVDYWERMRVSENARKVLKEICEEAEKEGFTSQQMHNAISNFRI